jgi:hypothetical protein
VSPEKRSVTVQSLKRTVLLLAMAVIARSLAAQTEIFDIASYTPPRGWKKEISADKVSFTVTNSAKNTYCVIGVYASRPSSGDDATDFMNEWKELIVKPFGTEANPKTQNIVTGAGIKAITGSSLFIYQGGDNGVLLASFRAIGKVTSVVTVMNSLDFQADVKKFLDGITFLNSTSSTTNTLPTGPAVQPSAPVSPTRDVSFAVPRGWTQTNYSDGVGLQSPDMECSNNSNYKIFIHHNRPFTGDLKTQAKEIWHGLFNPLNQGEVIMKKWTSPEGWDFLTFENDRIVSKANAAHFYARVLLVKQGSQVSVISLESNRTEFAGSNNLDCQALNGTWKRFVDSLQFKSAGVNLNTTEIPEELLGRWESKITTGVSYYGSVSTKTLAAYTFRGNGYCQSKKMFDSDADGKFSILGNKITIVSPGGLSETFTFRVESELAYDRWTKHLTLLDKNGNESRLLFQGD